MLKNLRTHILTIVLLPPIVITLALGAYLNYMRQQDLQAFSSHRSMQALKNIQTATHHVRKQEDINHLQAFITTALEEKGLRSIRVFDKNKQLIAQAGPQFLVLQSKDQFLSGTSVTIEDNQVIGISEPFKHKLFIDDSHSTEELEGDTVDIGWIAIEYAQDIYNIKSYESFLTQNTIMFIALLLSVLVGLRLGQKLTNDIKAINNSIKKIKEGDDIDEIKTHSCQEIESLAFNINDMASSLKGEFDELRRNVELTTSDLKETIDTIEIQNIELSLAQKEAQAASRIKSEFLANTSHEIRTPLNGIIGFTRILERTPLNPQQADYLETIQQSADGLLSIINDILDFSKIEAGKLELEQAPFDLEQVCESVLKLFAPSAYEKKLEIVLIIYQDVPTQLIGDAMRLRQVLSNLINNAIKFTSEGTITIRVSHEESLSTEAVLSISVTDTGIGLTDEQQKDLFKAFTQANNSISRKYGGTGLGLAIVEKLVFLMKGYIDIESEPEKGTTFSFTTRMKLQEDIEKPKNQQNYQGKSALLIEKHDLLKVSIKHLLEGLGIRVIEASDANNAIEKLDDFHVDFILHGYNFGLDINDFYRNAMHLSERAKTHIINFIPTHFDKRESTSDRRHFIDIYKPITSSRLLQAFNTLAHPEVLEHIQPSTSPELKSDASVLVVDDQPANLKLLQVLLGDLGMEVSTATNGQEAVDICQDKTFNMIFMDIQMPVMNGIEATMLIRNHNNPNKMTPIIATTAHALSDEKHNILEVGMNGYLTKPISEIQLKEIIKNIDQGSIQHKESDFKKKSSDEVDIALCLSLANQKPDLAIDMFTMLAESLSQEINSITVAFESNSWEGLLDLVHKLHGACCYTGVPKLKEAASDFEKALKSESDKNNDLGELFSNICDQAKAVITWHETHNIEELINEAHSTA